MQELGFKKYLIKYNSRRLINSILEDLKIPKAKQAPVIRILDKLDKIGVEGILKELKPLLDKKTAEELMKIVSVSGTTDTKLKKLSKYSIEEVSQFRKLVEDFGIKEESLFFDPSLARGLDYYTGIIFEVYIPEVNIGAVCAGGRYDDLSSMFMNEKFSGMGVAFGFDRLVVAMDDLGLLTNVSLNSKVLVTYFDEATLPTALKVLRDIQSAGINSEIYFEPAKLAKQFKYADKKQISFVVICGPEEVDRQEVTIKMMNTGKQKTIPQNQITNYFKGYSKI